MTPSYAVDPQAAGPFAVDPQFQEFFYDGVPRAVPGNGPKQTPPTVVATPCGYLMTYNGWSLTTQIDMGQIVDAWVYLLGDANNQLGPNGWNDIARMAELSFSAKDYLMGYTAIYPGDASLGLPPAPGTFAAHGPNSSWPDPVTGHQMYFDIYKKLHDIQAEAAAQAAANAAAGFGAFGAPPYPAPLGKTWVRSAMGWYLTDAMPAAPGTSGGAPVNPNVAAFEALSAPSQTKLLGMVPVLGLT